MNQEKLNFLAAILYSRRGEGLLVPYEKVAFGGRTPERGNCHENVDFWCTLHPEDAAARGWLLDDQGFGFAKFYAHSVVERAGGNLIEITIPDPQQRFINHDSEDCDFKDLLKQKIPEIRHVYDCRVYKAFQEARLQHT